MTTILVWVFMTISSNSQTVAYSPPMKDLTSCQRIAKAHNEMKGFADKGQCVQVEVFLK